MTADSSVGVPLSAPSPQPIRLHRARASKPTCSAIPNLALLPCPATARMAICGRIYILRYWSAAKWNSIPRRLRPENAILDDEGGARVFERDTTSSAEPSPFSRPS